MVYLTVKISSFARAIYPFVHLAAALVLSTRWNGLLCRNADDVSTGWEIVNFLLLSPNRWYQFHLRTIRKHFASIMTWNNWEMIAKTRSSNFRRRPRCLWRPVLLSFFLNLNLDQAAFESIEKSRLASAPVVFFPFVAYYLLGVSYYTVFLSKWVRERL